MILVLSVFFALSWLPFHVIYLTYYFRPSANVLGFLSTAQPFAQLLSASNSCVNPIIYSFVSRKWRTEFKHIFSIMCGGGAGQSATPPERRLTNRLTSNAGSECGLGGGRFGHVPKSCAADELCRKDTTTNNGNGYSSVWLVMHAPKKNDCTTS